MMKEHPARILAAVRQIEEMELTRQEVEALLQRHTNRNNIASQVIAAAAEIVLNGGINVGSR
jgi:hypothetical protein